MTKKKQRFVGLNKTEREDFKDLLLAVCFKYSKQIEDYAREIDPNGEQDIDNFLANVLSMVKGEPTRNQTAMIDAMSRTPKQIKSMVDEYLVGQEEAKKSLAVVYFNHIRRITAYETAEALGIEKDFSLGKSSAIMVGPTGTGKTYLIEQLSKYFDLPVYIGDASTITQAGFVGKSATDFIESLYIAAGKDKKRTENGVIFIDEIDKLSTNKSGKQNSMVESAQQSLLKLIEGCDVEIDGEKGPTGMGSKITINTKNILFVFAGAFVGMIDSNEKSSPIGYLDIDDKDSGKVKDNSRVMPKDLIEHGMIPELVGRISMITKLHHLDEDHLIDILKTTKNNAIEQYQNMFSVDGIKVTFTEDTYKEIAKTAVTLKTGARSLRSIIDFLMVDKIYDIELTGDNPTKEIVIDVEYTKDKLENYKSFKKENV